MTIKSLIKMLKQYPENSEVMLIVEDRAVKEQLSGIAYKVIGEGTGAEDGKLEIYAK